MEIFLAIGAVVIVSLISLVGVFTLSLNDRLIKRALFLLVALATGALLGDAFLHLIPEAIEHIGTMEGAAIAVISGILTFFILERVLQWRHAHHHHCEGDDCPPEPTTKPLGTLVLVSDGVHNFIDGVIIAASFLVSVEVGIASTIAIILHEIPQEIGDFGILLHAGYTRARALLLNFFSATIAILGTILTILYEVYISDLLIFAIPFAAGIFIYIAGSDLVPELHRRDRRMHIKDAVLELIAILLGVALMYGLLFFE